MILYFLLIFFLLIFCNVSFQVNDKYIIKSGTDFRNLAKILLTFPETGNPEIEVQQIDIDSTFEEDQKVKDIVLQYSGTFQAYNI